MSKKYKDPTIVVRGEWLDVYTPFSRTFVGDLKASIPHDMRKPIYLDGKFDCWRVHKDYMPDVQLVIKGAYRAQLAIEYGEKLGDDGIDQAQQVKVNSDPHVKVFEVWYVGRCKLRDETGSTPSAFFMNQDQKWVGLLPEDILRQWFEQDVDSADHFRLLGITAKSTDRETKKAYRAMARQYHPDVYDGDDSTERMKAINEAYGMLKTEQGRKRYAACLFLESKAHGMDAVITGVRADNKDVSAKYGYRCPKPNGVIKMSGIEIAGGRGGKLFLAQQILEWNPVIREGKRLISGYKKKDSAEFFSRRTRRRYGLVGVSHNQGADAYEFVHEWV